MPRGRGVRGVDDCRCVRRVVIMDLDPRWYGDADNHLGVFHFCPKIKRMTLDSKTALLLKGNMYCAVAAGINIQICMGAWEPRPRAFMAMSVFSYVSFRI